MVPIKDRIARLIAERCSDNDSEFARCIGVSSTTVGKWRRGETEPSREHKDKICVDYEISPAWLQGFDVPMVPEPTISTSTENALKALRNSDVATAIDILSAHIPPFTSADVVAATATAYIRQGNLTAAIAALEASVETKCALEQPNTFEACMADLISGFQEKYGRSPDSAIIRVWVKHIKAYIANLSADLSHTNHGIGNPDTLPPDVGVEPMVSLSDRQLGRLEGRIDELERQIEKYREANDVLRKYAWDMVKTREELCRAIADMFGRVKYGVCHSDDLFKEFEDILRKHGFNPTDSVTGGPYPPTDDLIFPQ